METVRYLLMQPAEGELVEKKSRFLANLYPVNNEEEAQIYIESVRKKYWDAKHHCVAMIIKNDLVDITRCNDDGEPSQTAGKPMMMVLQHENLCNVVAIVTRYFGGTLLGTGGLIRAYQGAVSEALKKAEIGMLREGFLLNFEVDYPLVPKILYLIEKKELTVLSSEYLERVKFSLQLPKDIFLSIKEEIETLSCGKVVMDEPVATTFIDKVK